MPSLSIKVIGRKLREVLGICKRGTLSLFQEFYRRLHRFPYPKLVELIQAFDSEMEAPRVLYLGDSVVERVADEDDDRRPLKQMVIDDLAPICKGICISNSAYHPQVFYYLLRALERMRNKPKFVILPINIRCFSPQWDFQPYWQFNEEVEVLRNYIKSPRGRIGRIKKRTSDDVPSSAMESFKATTVNYPGSSFSCIGQFLDVVYSEAVSEDQKQFRKKQIFIFHYMHPLTRSHPKVDRLNDILKLFGRMDVTALVYLTPINMKAGIKYAGPEFQGQVTANKKVISDLMAPFVSAGQARFFDWSCCLPPQCFFSEDLATEHLNQAGRHKLAHLIAEQISQQEELQSC